MKHYRDQLSHKISGQFNRGLFLSFAGVLIIILYTVSLMVEKLRF